jgi:hypothetical protein
MAWFSNQKLRIAVHWVKFVEVGTVSCLRFSIAFGESDGRNILTVRLQPDLDEWTKKLRIKWVKFVKVWLQSAACAFRKDCRFGEMIDEGILPSDCSQVWLGGLTRLERERFNFHSCDLPRIPSQCHSLPGFPPQCYSVPGFPPQCYPVPGFPPQCNSVPGFPPQYNSVPGFPPQCYSVPGSPPWVPTKIRL